jgi:hypothetical protein
MARSSAVTPDRVAATVLNVVPNWAETVSAGRAESALYGLQCGVRTNENLFLVAGVVSSGIFSLPVGGASGGAVIVASEVDLSSEARSASVLEGTNVVVSEGSALSFARPVSVFGSEGSEYSQDSPVGLLADPRPAAVETTEEASPSMARVRGVATASDVSVETTYGLVADAGRVDAAGTVEDPLVYVQQDFSASACTATAVAREVGIGASSSSVGKATSAAYGQEPTVSLGTAVSVSPGRATAAASGAEYTESASISAEACELSSVAWSAVVNEGYAFIDGIWGPIYTAFSGMYPVLQGGEVRGPMSKAASFEAALDDDASIESDLFGHGESGESVEEDVDVVARRGGVRIREL